MNYAIMTLEELPACREITTRAFMNYPYFTVHFPDPKKRESYIRGVVDMDMRLNRDHSVYFTARDDDGTLAAVGQVCPPGYRDASDLKYFFGGYWKFIFTQNIGAMLSWLSMREKAGEPCHAISDMWYANLLTVDPPYQGKGVGSGMMRDCFIPYIKAQGGKGMTLFTNTEYNREYYRRKGFKEFDERFFEYKGGRVGSWSFRMDF
ncbi:MAG: GNAT family N-acetyltransferase [Lachnospiraceae bacterium]|nr:GNAT family N-acetyltransferase [Lachnospiraceae bacterium]